MYVYQSFEPRLYTVGFYSPDGKFQPESDHDDKEAAAGRVAWLNGAREDENPYILHGEELKRAELRARSR